MSENDDHLTFILVLAGIIIVCVLVAYALLAIAGIGIGAGLAIRQQAADARSEHLAEVRKIQGESAYRREQMADQLKPLDKKLRQLADTRQLVVNDLTVDQETIRKFTERETDLKAECQQGKAACQITSFDEARLRSCDQLALPLRELNKIVRYRKQLEKNSGLLQDMLPQIDFQTRNLNYDIDLLVAAGGGDTKEAIKKVNAFLKDFALPSSDISKINENDLPAFSLQETWDLIGKP